MNTLFVTASGKTVDLYRPEAGQIDFGDIAEHLAKEARFNGGTPGAFYSVAQHLIFGSDWIVETPEVMPNPALRKRAAAYFLAHDFHEYVLKDEVTPKKRAADRVAQEFGAAAGSISDAFTRLVERHDAAIHEAAGLAWPPPKEMQSLVALIDKRILLTEWAALHGGHDLIGDYAGIEPLPITIRPMPWEVAKEELLIRMQQLLPVFARAADASPAKLAERSGEVKFG